MCLDVGHRRRENVQPIWGEYPGLRIHQRVRGSPFLLRRYAKDCLFPVPHIWFLKSMDFPTLIFFHPKREETKLFLSSSEATESLRKRHSFFY